MAPPPEKDDVGTQDPAKLLHTPPKANTAKAKKAKVCKPPAVPWSDYFTVEANDGAGDCGYIAIAQCLNFQSGKAGRTDPQDFAPAGRLQAALRMIASKQIRDHPHKYVGGNADRTAKAGIYAEHIALTALANASHLDIGIFAWDNQLKQWDFYRLKSNQQSKAQPTRVWLKLEAQHYEWLKPKQATIPHDFVKTWQDAAKYQAQLPAGGARDHDALSLLGLQATSSQQASQASQPRDALSLLGLNDTSTPNTSGKRYRLKRKTPPTVQTETVATSDATPVNTEAGAHLHCPCGWTPPPGPANAQRNEARKHWQRCQGTHPPKRSAAAKAEHMARWQQASHACQKQYSIELHKEWEAKFLRKHSHLKSSLCKPEYNLPFYHASGTKYPCSRCGATKPLALMRRDPCSKRPEGVTVYAWQKAVIGKKLADQRAYQRNDWNRGRSARAAANRAEE